MRFTAIFTIFAGLALLGCTDDAERQAYEGCVANQREASGRNAEIFCGCLREDSNLDMSAAHPAEECAYKAAAANSSGG